MCSRPEETPHGDLHLRQREGLPPPGAGRRGTFDGAGAAAGVRVAHLGRGDPQTPHTLRGVPTAGQQAHVRFQGILDESGVWLLLVFNVQSTGTITLLSCEGNEMFDAECRACVNVTVPLSPVIKKF